MRHLNKILDHFWKRWRQEYLLELRTSHRLDYKKGDKVKTISIGQVVLIHDENHPRGLWKLALVEELIKGSDGQVRGARVRTQSGLDRSVILNRPVQHLYPLEVASENMVDDQTNCDGNVPSHNSVIQTNETRPTRRAAIRARDQLRQDVFNIESDDD